MSNIYYFGLDILKFSCPTWYQCYSKITTTVRIKSKNNTYPYIQLHPQYNVV